VQREHSFTALPRNLQLRVALLMGATLLIAGAFIYYALYSRGAFEPLAHVVLVTEDADGVTVGMELSFAGFPIGRVENLSLAEDGRARILVELMRKDARWLRTTSVFTLEKGLFGSPRLRAHTANLQDPQLPDRAERPMLRGDASEEIPRMVATLKSALQNIEAITAAEGSLQASLDNLRRTTDRMGGKQGALATAVGEEDALKVVATIDRARVLIESLDRISLRLESMAGKAEERLFAKGGMVESAEGVVAEAGQILGGVRETLKRADALLADAQQVGANTRAATQDLASLRAEVDASLRKMDILVDEVNRKWPFRRDTEIRLP
jgi:phospholipid/cholesterol/gamma-HCH transport system substrate-binding protein